MAEQNLDNGNREQMELVGVDCKRLRAGEKVLCHHCGIGYFIPCYNAPASEAHYFKCSNPECDSFIHFDPVVIIE